MSTTRVLVSGAGVAGPALACALARPGVEVTVVEKAPELRPGGQPVDVKGGAQLAVLRRMGLLDDVRAARTRPEDGTVVDAAGRTLAVVPSEFSAGDLEIPRGDLVRLLHARTAPSCEYLFGESVTSLTEIPGGVEVTFSRSAARTFDLVVGADGIHSTVRRLAFGPEAEHVRYRGYHYAVADIDVGEPGRMYNEPGRMAVTGGPDAPAFFVFAADRPAGHRDDVAAQKATVLAAYRGAGWRVPELMAAIPGAEGFHLDTISRVTIDRYVEGRVVLLGDAAWGNALGGFGTGLALLGASVLADELVRAEGDPAAALARYETSMRARARKVTGLNSGRILAPRTRTGLRARNRAFVILALFRPLMRLAGGLTGGAGPAGHDLDEHRGAQA